VFVENLEQYVLGHTEEDETVAKTKADPATHTHTKNAAEENAPRGLKYVVDWENGY
jgi:hypothetical protein